MNYVALHGPKFSGKSTLARELERRGYLYINFTDQLKELLALALQAVGMTITLDDIIARKEYYRRLLVEWSKVIGFNTDPTFVYRSLRSWDAAGRPPAVFDNVRFIEQFLPLSRSGFSLVCLSLSPADQFSRARMTHSTMTYEQFCATVDDRSEAGISSDWFDLVLDASQDVVLLADEVVRANMPEMWGGACW